jgi:putative DNA primase/helicase
MSATTTFLPADKFAVLQAAVKNAKELRDSKLSPHVALYTMKTISPLFGEMAVKHVYDDVPLPEVAEGEAIAAQPVTPQEPEQQPTDAPVELLSDVPLRLKSLSRWVYWKLDLDKDGKPTKVPYQVNGRKASSTDPSTWTTFQTAVTGAIINTEQGVGFVVNGDGIFGIDLDGCRDPKTGKIAEWAERIIDACESYAEYTPSETGLRVWVRGKLPPGSRVFNLNPAVGYGEKVKIEIYERSRYFTVTGDSFYEEATDVVEIDANSIYQMLHDIRAQHPAPVNHKTAEKSATAVDVCTSGVPIVYAPGSNIKTDKYTIFKTGRVWKDGDGFHVSNGHGTLTYPSQSEADLGFATALALFHDGDANKMDEDFRESALYREKWGRDKYREDTFQKALETASKIKESKSKSMDLTATISPCAARAIPATIPVASPEVPASKAIPSEDLDVIPPFDDSVITGIFRDIVDLVTNGTTIPRQFPFLAAKVYVGARMAGGMTFEGVQDDPTMYGTPIGETGTSKGLSWERTVYQTLLPTELLKRPVKVIYSFDSGAGLRDAFFDPPQELPVIGYIDEVRSLGHKAGEKKNPEIVDTIIELANSHRISRSKAKRSKSDKVMSHEGAYLGLYMNGQDGDAFMSSFPGRKEMGLWDRFYPEYSDPIEPGDLPLIDVSAAFKMIARLNEFPFKGRMTMAEGVNSSVKAFWNGLPKDVRVKVRFKSHLMLDMYFAAWSQGRMVATMEDLDVAIRIFRRQVVIRRVHFTEEVPDRVGHYIGLLKKLTESMRKRLNAGASVETVAMSLRDFQTDTNAFRENELVTFNTAWRNFQADHLAIYKHTAKNGHQYEKFLPMPYEDEMWAATPKAKAAADAAAAGQAGGLG